MKSRESSARALVAVTAIVLLLTGCASSSVGTALSSGRSQAPAASSAPGDSGTTGSPAAADGTLSQLYEKLIADCQGNPAACEDGQVQQGISETAFEDASSFCARFIGDSKAVLTTIGVLTAQDNPKTYPYVTSYFGVGLGEANTVGNLDPNGETHASCGDATDQEQDSFSIALTPAPAAVNYAGTGASRLAFGKPCVVEAGEIGSGGSGQDIACILSNGWGFNISEGIKPAVPAATIQQMYNALTADL